MNFVHPRETVECAFDIITDDPCRWGSPSHQHPHTSTLTPAPSHQHPHTSTFTPACIPHAVYCQMQSASVSLQKSSMSFPHSRYTTLATTALRLSLSDLYLPLTSIPLPSTPLHSSPLHSPPLSSPPSPPFPSPRLPSPQSLTYSVHINHVMLVKAVLEHCSVPAETIKDLLRIHHQVMGMGLAAGL